MDKKQALSRSPDSACTNIGIPSGLDTVANARIHGTTGERPERRLVIERDHLLQLPSRQEIIVAAPRTSAPVPFESLQHPLSVYQALLEVAA